jgi:hypothetical protein
MAVIAAAPVLNTACDPAPSPSCSTTSATDLANEVSASAVWFKDTRSPLTTDYHLTLTLSGRPTEGAIVPVTVN